MIVDTQLAEVLRRMHALGARVTGSLARGEAHDGSDIDLYIPPSKGDKKWREAAAIMKATGWRLESPFIFCWSTRESSTMLEISCLFDRTPKVQRLDSVTLAGIMFRTW